MTEALAGLPLHPGTRITLESLSSVALPLIRLVGVYAKAVPPGTVTVETPRLTGTSLIDDWGSGWLVVWSRSGEVA